MSFQKALNLKVVFNIETIETHFLVKFIMLFVSLIYYLRNREKTIGSIEFRLTTIITLVQQSSSKAHMHIRVLKEHQTWYISEKLN